MQFEKDDSLSRAIAKIEILSFFRKHPHTRDTLEGLTRRLWLDVEAVASVMDDLVRLGIITKSGNGNQSVYRLKVSYSTSEEQDSSLAGEHSCWT